MGKEIDEKVVSMKFDNQSFMENTSATMTQLEKLKQSLRLPGASKALDDVNKSASDIRLSPLGVAAEQVGVKFNAMAAIAFSALQNITNTAVNAGKRIVSALTIDPIKTGLQEYETQINAVQTILANTESKGTTLDDVNKALDQLNTYADKTIYNFTEMTRNIGTFTAAGVDLDTSVNAIQGIANLAAVSGSNSQQASTAMYQLSQALSSGTVKLMDWNSVVNAGMGGQVFQDALKETARVHGIAIDDMIKDNGSFRETLQEGWLTSEILTETLQKFTLATEGLTEEQIEQNRAMLKSKGYTDEQIDGIFKLGNTATNAATKVKTFTQLMDTLKESVQSGWTQTWEILVGDFEEAKTLWTSVSDIFGKIIGDAAEARNTLLQGWKDGGGRDDLIESFKNMFKSISSIVKPIKEAFREIFPKTTAKQLIKITEAIKNFTSKLILSKEAQEKLKSTFKGLFAVVDIGVTFIKEIVKGIADLLDYIPDLLGGIVGVGSSFGEWVSGIRDTVKESGVFGTIIGGIVKVLQRFIDALKIVLSFLKEKFVAPGFEGFLALMKGLWNVVKFVGDKIFQVLGALGKGLLDAFRKGDFKAALDVFNTGVLGSILLTVKGFMKNLSDGFGSLGGTTDIIDGVKDILGSVKDTLTAYQKDIQANTLLKIAGAIGILATAILVIASIDPGRLTTSLGAISVLFADLIMSMKGLNSIGDVSKGAIKNMGLMVAMSVSILLLASALKKISGIDTKELAVGLIGVFGLMKILTSALETINKNDKKIAKASGQLIGMAIALDLLTISVKVLSGMSLEELAKGLGGMTVGLYALVGALAIMSKFNASGAGQILVMSIALTALALAVKAIGSMDLVNIAKGVGALVVVIYALVGAAALMNGLIVGAGAMLLLSAAMIGFAVGLTMLVPALLAFSYIDMGAVCSGLLKLSGTLVVLGAASLVAPLLVLMAWGLKALGAGLIALIPAMLAITLLDFGSICVSLLKLAGVLLVLGLAAAIAPALVLLGTGLTLLGVGALLAGPGLLALSAGLTAFAASFAVSAAGIVAGMTIIIEGIIGLIPTIIAAIFNGIRLICEAIIGSIGTICEALGAVILALCDLVIQSLPKIFEVLTKLFVLACDFIIKMTPKILEALGVLLEKLLEFIVKYVPKIVVAGMELIIGLLDGISKNIGKVIEKAVEVVISFIDGLYSQVPRLVTAAFEIILDFINGIADAIETYTPQIMNACTNLGVSIVKGVVKGLVSTPGIIWDGIKSVCDTIWTGFKETLGINSPAKTMIPFGQGIDEGVVVGLEKYKGLVTDATEDVGKTAIDSMSNAISGIADIVESDIDAQPTIRPVLDLSNIESGAGAINSMFGMQPSVDVLSNVGSISSMMNRNQNGDSDLLSAIKKLGDKLTNIKGNTYIIDGVTYDDGSNVADAINELARAIKIEGRI